MPDGDAELAKLQELFPTEEAYAAWQHDSLRSVTPPQRERRNASNTTI